MLQMELSWCDKYQLWVQALGSFHAAIRLVQNSSAIRIFDTRLLLSGYLATYQASTQGVTLTSNPKAAGIYIHYK